MNNYIFRKINYIKKSKFLIPLLKLNIYTFISRLVAFILLTYLSNILNYKDFANWQIIKSIFGYLLVCMDAGIYNQSSIFIQKFNYSIESILKKIYLLRGTILLLLSPFLFLYLSSTNLNHKEIFYLLPLLFIFIFNYEAFSISIGQSLFSSKIIFFKNLIFLGLIIIFIKYSNTLQSVIFAFTIASFFSFISHFRKFKSININKNKNHLNTKVIQLIWQSKYFILYNICQTSMQTADLIIGNLTLTSSEISIYAIALTFAEFTIAPCYTYIKLIYSEFCKNPNFKTIRKYLKFIFILPSLTLLICLFYPKLFSYIFAKYDFILFSKILSILLIYSFLRIINSLVHMYYQVSNKVKIVSLATIFGALLNISLNIMFIPAYGLEIMPFITVLSEFVILIFPFLIFFKNESK